MYIKEAEGYCRTCQTRLSAYAYHVLQACNIDLSFTKAPVGPFGAIKKAVFVGCFEQSPTDCLLAPRILPSAEDAHQDAPPQTSPNYGAIQCADVETVFPANLVVLLQSADYWHKTAAPCYVPSSSVSLFSEKVIGMFRNQFILMPGGDFTSQLIYFPVAAIS